MKSMKSMMLFGGIKKVKSNALTELFHRYLEFLFQEQLQKRMKTLWMRKGDLDEPLPDEPFCKETLRSILKNQHTVPKGAPNIFILQGDMGDGRRFYLKKMIEVCYEEIHHIGWEQAQKQDVEFRFPILAVQEVVDWAKSESGPLNLVDFALRCMIQQLGLNSKEQDVARELLEKLSQMGKLAVFFNEDMFDDTNALINQLTVSERQEYQPIAVFIESSQFSVKRDGKCYCIRIRPLKIQQIVRYLCAELPGHYCARETEKMLQEQAEVADILGKPERLLLHISAVKGDTALKDATNITITKIYESFLSNQIDQAYKSQDDIMVSRTQLKEWLVCRAQAKEFPNDTVGQQCQRCFTGTEIFHSNLTNFRFEGCKDYLIAQGYFSSGNPWNNVRKRIKHILLNEHPMVLKFYAGIWVEKNRHPGTFFKQLVALMNDPRENEVREACNAPAKLLADILTFTGRVGSDGAEFVKWAGKEMRKDVYDTSVLEVLSGLNKQNAAIASQLEDRYTKTENAREKRRIVYCFGYLGPGYFPEQIIREFYTTCSGKMDDKTCHLQYHISTALIDCCQQSEDLFSFPAQLENVLGKHSDPILRSDFDTLYTKINKKRYLVTRKEQQQCEDELISLLEHGTYFQMAHAAGALGRRNYDPEDWGILSVIGRLLNVLDRILSDMSQIQTVDFNALKTVSYIVESCCKLAERNNSCYTEVRTGLRQQLESHLEVLLSIDVPILVYQCLEVALELVATGLIWLVKIDPKPEIRTELGLCFSSKTTIQQALFALRERDWEADEVWLEEKILALEELFDATKLEEKLRCKFQYQSECGRELDFSLAYLKYDEKPIMAGFLFCYQSNIYFITCRHCFFEEDIAKNLRIPLEKLEQVGFSLACLDDVERYHGIMRYPKNISDPVSFDDNAAADLVVYQLIDVPMCLAQVIFSEKSVLAGANGKEGRMKAFSFPEWSRIPGRHIYGSCYNAASRGFFSLVAEQQQPLGSEADWFSGVPIIKEGDDMWIVGMWKASDNQEQKIFGITMSTILSELDKISKERMSDI